MTRPIHGSAARRRIAVIAGLVLAYPSGRLQDGFERRITISGYALAILAPVLLGIVQSWLK